MSSEMGGWTEGWREEEESRQKAFRGRNERVFIVILSGAK